MDGQRERLGLGLRHRGQALWNFRAKMRRNNVTITFPGAGRNPGYKGRGEVRNTALQCKELY